MSFRRRLGGALRQIRARQRRTWNGPDRAWIELRELLNGDQGRVVASLSRELQAEAGIHWVRYNGRYARLVVAFDPQRWSFEALLQRVEALEDGLGCGQAPLGHQVVRHPADQEPAERAIIEIAIHVASLIAGLSLRMSRTPVRSRHVDFAALTTALRNVPRLRAVVERQLGPSTAELVLEGADALARALMQGSTGAAVDLIEHALRLRERRGRAAVWGEWEPHLGAHPDAHRPEPVVREERVTPLPDGSLERYMEQAVLASLGAFSFGLAATGDAETATAPLFGGIPKPARVGRASFIRHLARRLGREGVLVQHAEVLDCLDRVDAWVVDGDCVDGPAHRAILREARALGMRLIAFSDEERGLAVEQLIAPRALRPTIRRLQVEGHVVAVLGGPSCTGFAVADLAVGIVDRGAPAQAEVPWGADLIWDGRPAALRLLMRATGAAQRATKHAVWLSAAEATVSMVMALGGVRRRALRHILEASSLASMAALVDSVRLVEGIDAEVAEVRAGPMWHTLEVEQVLQAVESGVEGLDAADAETRRQAAPELPGELRQLAGALAEELRNPLTPVLVGGAGLSALVGSTIDAAMVLGVVGVNTLVGGTQRWRTERVVRGFIDKQRPPVQVMRGGRPRRVEAEQLVVGDVVRLGAGDLVPADCRLIEADGLEVDESSLTGESLPIAKHAGALPEVALPERANMLYAGTSIAAGTARAVVVATGGQTEAAQALPAAHIRPPRGVEERLRSLTDMTLPVAASAGLAVLAAGVLRQRKPEELVGTAVGLAVASVPEGLPVLATMAQLAAARRLGARGALVRHPRAIEALGRMEVLCADKTGTLTEGVLRLGAVSDGERVWDLGERPPEHVRELIAAALRSSPRGRSEQVNHHTDRAVIEGGLRIGVRRSDGLAEWAWEAELPFAPSRSYSATLGRLGRRWVLSVKGSPEAILAGCATQRVEGAPVKLTAARRRALADHAERLAEKGWRVLAVAERIGSQKPELAKEELLDLELLGFVGLMDPVRDSARRAVDTLKAAGVSVRLVTGDHPGTARAVATQLGLDADALLTGDEVEGLEEAELVERARGACVFARVTPAQKVRIVSALQQGGRAVGMTGDGANDVPAIQLADVGIALGESATPAARQAADLVVMDGRIETLVDAVLEGRKLWISVRDAVSMLVGGNLGEIGFTVVGGLSTGSAPLNTRQLLLVNLLTDAIPAMVIAVMPPSSLKAERLLEEGPDRSLDERLTRHILWRAAVTGGTASLAWRISRFSGSRRGANTVGLLTLVGTQLGQTLIVGRRSPLVLSASLASMGALLIAVQTPGLSRFFGCRPVGPLGLTQAGLSASGGAVFAAVAPAAVRRYGPRVRAFIDRHRLRDQELVRLVVESRGASRARHQLDQLRELLRPEGGARPGPEEAPAPNPDPPAQ